MRSRLLAKSWRRLEEAAPPAYAELVPHLRAVQAVGDVIVSELGGLILANLELEPAIWLPRLQRCLSLACLMHDIGKANSAFQDMVRGQLGTERQPIRHEFLSMIWLLDDHPLGSWLTEQLRQEFLDDGIVEDLRNCVVGAVGGHHVKLDPQLARALPALRGGCGTRVHALLGDESLRTVFRGAQLADHQISLLPESGSPLDPAAQTDLLRRNHSWRRKLESAPDWRRFAATLKALVVASDVAGSALLPEGESPRTWVGTALRRRAAADDFRQVVDARLSGLQLRPFQQRIAGSKSRVTLVEAGCGTGKTVAAYQWAMRWAHGRKLFFCYPTTGTATEGFLGYVAQSPVEGRLIHSRSHADLAGLASCPDETNEDELARFESLSGWDPEVIVCTAHTVLALARNNRRGLYTSPSILSGAFVFDELHAYDEEMFAAVAALIGAMPGAPFLLMSASLPQRRREWLRANVERLGEVERPTELESVPRYLFERSEESAAYEVARAAVREGKYVLWVVNTVSAAQSLLDRALADGLSVAAYHSRFRYADRVRQHRRVVDAFSARNSEGFLAVTTQVAEMSLDLDADLLVTQMAPVPALIQRLGRLNRRVSEERPGSPRTAFFVRSAKVHPYAPDQVAEAELWLNTLIALQRPLSQRDLSEAFSELDAGAPALSIDVRCEWLDSGWLAEPGSVTEPAMSASVLLPDDVAASRRSRIELTRRTLPIAYRARMSDWEAWNGILLAPRGVLRYDDRRGAAWA